MAQKLSKFPLVQDRIRQPATQLGWFGSYMRGAHATQ